MRAALGTFDLGRGVVTTIVVVLVAACSQTPVQKAEADLAAVRKESDAKTLVERGKAFASIGDHTRAEEYLATSLDVGADPREVLPLLMDVCVRGGRYRSAIQHGELHLRKHPHDEQTRVMVGALYVALNEGKMARAQLEKVVPPEPKPEPKPESTTTVTTDDATKDGGASTTVVAQPAQPVQIPKAIPFPPALNAKAADHNRIKAEAHYLLGVVSRDSENDVVEADLHFREYLRLEPNGSHAEEARSSLLKKVPSQP